MIFPKPEKGIYIFSRDNCINCEKLKGYLINNNKEFKTIWCDKYYENEELKTKFREYLLLLTGRNIKVYPIVFIDGVYYGSYYDLLDYYGDF